MGNTYINNEYHYTEINNNLVNVGNVNVLNDFSLIGDNFTLIDGGILDNVLQQGILNGDNLLKEGILNGNNEILSNIANGEILSNLVKGDILSDNEIVKNVLSGDIASDILNGNKVGDILSGQVLGDVKITDVLSGSVEALTHFANADILNDALNGTVTGLDGDIFHAPVDILTDVVNLDGDLLSNNAVGNVFASVDDIVGGNDILNDVLEGGISNVLNTDVSEVVHNVAIGNVVTDVLAGGIEQVVGDVASPEILAGIFGNDLLSNLLSGNPGSDLLDLDPVTTVTGVAGGLLGGADLDVGGLLNGLLGGQNLLSGGLVGAVVGGDDILGGILGGASAADNLHVDNVLDQLIGNTILSDIDPVHVTDLVHDLIS